MVNWTVDDVTSWLISEGLDIATYIFTGWRKLLV